MMKCWASLPIVINGGSWKTGFNQVLPLADYAICSANFYPPQCRTQTVERSFLIKYLDVAQYKFAYEFCLT